MPKVVTVKFKRGKDADYYKISMEQFAQQILRLPQGTVDFVKCPQFAGVGYKICTYAVC